MTDGNGDTGVEVTVGDTPRVLALPPTVLDRSIHTLEDARSYFDPDLVLLLGPEREPQATARARHVFDEPVVHPPLGDGGPVTRHDLETVSLVTVQRGTVLEEAASICSAALDDDAALTLVCDEVTTTVRPTALETTLEYASELATLVDLADLRRNLVVLTGGLPATYDETWHLERSGTCLGVGEEATPNDDAVAVRVHGTGPVDGYSVASSISSLSLTAGTAAAAGGIRPLEVGVETLDVSAFGLEAVANVGPKTAARFTERGITSRAELLETPVEALCDLPGVGRRAVEKMHHHAAVLETGEIRRVTDEPVPGERAPKPPLCLDIETDGLSPTILWQIGVYDPDSDEYRAFVERSNPTDPGSVLESFCEWLLGAHPDRTLCTWNGWRFDYKHLGAFVARHVPHYASEWERVSKSDLYHWAVGEGNALLPGRTNTLEDVSSALGYDGPQTGLDGAATAAAYQRFIRTGEELEWARHEAYCEDDCRALWHVYERIREAPRVESARRNSSHTGLEPSNTDPTRRSSEQTGLGDF